MGYAAEMCPSLQKGIQKSLDMPWEQDSRICRPLELRMSVVAICIQNRHLCDPYVTLKTITNFRLILLGQKATAILLYIGNIIIHNYCTGTPTSLIG